MAALKQLYRGSFNLNRVLRVEYAYAYTERQAWAIMCRRMAKKDGVPLNYVMGLFNGGKANYEISIELEIREKEESSGA